jgi:polyisoprenyl-teichoic acid--peptidoglycan teichoic acid transferase
MKKRNQIEDKLKKDDHKKNGKRKKIIISVVIVLIAVFAGIGIYSYSLLNKVKSTDIPKDNNSLGIKVDAIQQINQEDPGQDIINIALFGLDRRSKDEASRSDAIMVASIDKKHDKIKLSSVMRDTYVEVPGYGMTKITHAYAYGGPQLAIKTLNQNFNLDIKDYVTVDFFSLEKIIDILGGVTIDVRQEEIPYINSYMKETSNIEKEKIANVTQSGKVDLNGMQAVAYSRIRYIGNDFERTERQRKVLTEMLNKIQEAGLTKYPSIVSALLPYVETSISKGDMISLGASILTSGTKTIDQERFPVDGYWKDLTINGVYYLGTDLKVATDQLHKYIYEDVKPK